MAQSNRVGCGVEHQWSERAASGAVDRPFAQYLDFVSHALRSLIDTPWLSRCIVGVNITLCTISSTHYYSVYLRLFLTNRRFYLALILFYSHYNN